MKDRLAALLSRKFIAVIGGMGCSQWSLIEGLITGEIYRALMLGIVAAFVTANVVQKAVESKP